MTSASFYFDLAWPGCYLVAERILHFLPEAAEWQPVLGEQLTGGAVDDSPAFREGVERRAEELGLQRLRWPEPFPFDSSLAMRVASYAKSIGRTVPFAQAAFRQAFAGGHALDDPDYVLIAGAACEMHPAAVLKGAESRTVADALAARTAAAAGLGIALLPALSVGDRVFQGAGALDEAAAALRAGAGRL